MKKISIVVPCYNEEESLPLFYEEMRRITREMESKAVFEFVFVNDGSRDKTLEILRKFARMDDRVRYISFSRNFGKEAAIYAGLEHASGDNTQAVFHQLVASNSIGKIIEYILFSEKSHFVIVTFQRISQFL